MSAFQEIASDAPLPVHAETGPAIDAPHDTLFSIPELLESARATRIHEFIKILHRLHLNIKHRDMVLALQDEDAQLVIDVIQLVCHDYPILSVAEYTTRVWPTPKSELTTLSFDRLCISS